MKKTLKIIWKCYSIAGAIWLSFTLLSFGILHGQEKREVSGIVREIVETEWDGINEKMPPMHEYR